MRDINTRHIAPMFDLSITLLVFLFPLAWSPGPGNLFFAANGARFGLAATLPLSIGYHGATWIVTYALGLGIAASLTALPMLTLLIKWASVLYMLWLVKGFIGKQGIDNDPNATPAGFRDGVILLLLNPKAYTIILLMMSQFLIPIAPYGGSLTLATVFTLHNLLAFTVWTVAGDKLARRFRTGQSAQRLNTLFGALLIAVALWMLLSPSLV